MVEPERTPVDGPWRAALHAQGYVWIQALGKGASATVHLIEDLSTGERFAAKRLHPELASHSGARQRFVHEARIGDRVEHRGVLGVVELHDEDPAPWLVLPYAPGGSLAEHVQRAGPVPPLRVLAWGIAICDALEALHAQGIIHRDLKPQNILLDDAERPMLADFGAAWDVDRATLTHTGALLGTLAYMAPEAKQGQGASKPTADVYSLCAALLYLPTGTAPYDAFVPRRFQVLSASLPRPLAAVLQRGTRYEPEARYPTAAALKGALVEVERALHAAASQVETPSRQAGKLPTAALAATLAATVGLWVIFSPGASAASGVIRTSERPLLDATDLTLEGALLVAANLGGDDAAQVGCLRFEPGAVETNHLNHSAGDFCVGCVDDPDLDAVLSTNVFQHWSGIYGNVVLPVSVGERYRLQLLRANDQNRTGASSRVQVNGVELALDPWDGTPQIIDIELVAATSELVVGLLDNLGRDEERGMLSAVLLHALNEPGSSCSETTP